MWRVFGNGRSLGSRRRRVRKASANAARKSEFDLVPYKTCYSKQSHFFAQISCLPCCLLAFCSHSAATRSARSASGGRQAQADQRNRSQDEAAAPQVLCCTVTTAHLLSGQCTAAGSTQMGQEQGCCSKTPTASEPGATAGQPQRLHVSPRTVPVKASKPATASLLADQKQNENRDLSSSGVGVGGGASSPVSPPTTSGLSVVSVGQLVMHFSGAVGGGAGSSGGGGGGASKRSRRDDEITYNVNVLNAVNRMWSHSDDDRVDDLVNRWSTLEIVYLKVRAAWMRRCSPCHVTPPLPPPLPATPSRASRSTP